jgi:transcriptional regulator with AAA-type ATPase domain
MKSDPASTVDAQAAPADAESQAELALLSLSGSSGCTPIRLEWRESADLTLGRDEDCAVRLNNTDVSRHHAALRRTASEPGTLIIDLNSRNGTRVNGRAVRTARLQANDVVRLGGCVFIVTEGLGSFGELAPGLLAGAALQRALSPLNQAARTDLPIVLEGETGTGKEVVTRAVHAWSGRTGPLVAINCAALPQGLAEGELFGYRRGAFTGADRASPGFFRSAEGGTLLLDEVTDLPLALQAKLLRALEQKEVQPLGETRPVPFDVRIVVAAQSSLFEAVKKQLFRADLLARLSGFTLQIPALRQRREEILPLFLHFMNEHRRGDPPELEPDLIERLCLHDWPFNVRELLLLARRLAVFQGAETMLRARDLPKGLGEVVDEAKPAEEEQASPHAAPRATSEPPHSLALPQLLAELRVAGGNVTRAASQLGITRQRAYRLLEEHSVDLSEFSDRPRPKRPVR